MVPDFFLIVYIFPTSIHPTSDLFSLAKTKNIERDVLIYILEDLIWNFKYKCSTQPYQNSEVGWLISMFQMHTLFLKYIQD